MTETTQDNPSYRKVLDGLLRMHELFVAGERESAEVKQLRDDIDDPYSKLTDEQREAIEGLSTDLFDVEKITSEPIPKPVPLADEHVQRALLAQYSDHYDDALKLLRAGKSSRPFSRISYFRGRNWEGKGEPKVALLFFHHAVQLDPENEEYKASALGALYNAFPREGQKQVEAVLANPIDFAPALVIRACEIKFQTLQSVDEGQYRKVCGQIVTALHAALFKMQETENRKLISEFQPVYSVVCSLLATCCRNLGMIDPAFHYYTMAIGLDPLNAALLIARGSVLYWRTEQATIFAVEDFDRALRIGTDLAIPFFFMSHFWLQKGQFRQTIKYVDAGLNKVGSKRLKSEMLELKAIALAGMFEPSERVISTFMEAQDVDRTNKRAISNLKVYEAMLTKNSTMPTQGPWLIKIDAISVARELPGPRTLREIYDTQRRMAG